MRVKTIDKKEIVEKFQSGISCSQLVLGEWAEALGYEREEALRMAAAFGGGMQRGDTCGAVTGALIAIGLRFGNSEPSDQQAKKVLREKVQEFQQKFSERCGSTVCRDLIGFDFAKAGELEKARASGKILEYCPTPVLEALSLLDELMGEENE